MKKYTLAALTLLVTALPLSAQKASLPDAKTLTAKYAAAVGGDAMTQWKSMKSTGTFEMPAMGVSASLEVLRANPNKNVVHINIPGMGEVVQGFDGTVGYSINPMAGNTLLTGKELDAMAEESQTAAQLRKPEIFASMETVDTATYGGVKCYKVKLVWKVSGRTSYDCYAVDTGLLAATLKSQETPQGTVDVTTTFGEYKQFGAIKAPTKMTQALMNMEQVMTIDKIEFDTVDPSAFALPAAIQALVPKK